MHASARVGARLAFSTLLLNASALLRQRRAGSEEKTTAICALQAVLTAAETDAEVRLRGVLAVGTLVDDDAETAALACGLDLGAALADVRDAAGTDELRAAAAHVERELRRAAGE